MKNDRDSAATPQAFITNRAELFKRLVLDVPGGYTTTDGEYGTGRVYHKTVGDSLDALRAFCDEKENIDGSVVEAAVRTIFAADEAARAFGRPRGQVLSAALRIVEALELRASGTDASS